MCVRACNLDLYRSSDPMGSSNSSKSALISRSLFFINNCQARLNEAISLQCVTHRLLVKGYRVS